MIHKLALRYMATKFPTSTPRIEGRLARGYCHMGHTCLRKWLRTKYFVEVAAEQLKPGLMQFCNFAERNGVYKWLDNSDGGPELQCVRGNPLRDGGRETQVSKQSISHPFPFLVGRFRFYSIWRWSSLLWLYRIYTFFMNIHAVSWLLDYVCIGPVFRIYSILAKQFL